MLLLKRFAIGWAWTGTWLARGRCDAWTSYTIGPIHLLHYTDDPSDEDQ
jgi:hypothetical protein